MPPKAEVNSIISCDGPALKSCSKAFQDDREAAAGLRESFHGPAEERTTLAIDLGKVHGPTASGRPFNSDVIATYAADIEIACQRIASDYLAGTLAYLAERLQKAVNSDAEFLFEFSPRR